MKIPIPRAEGRTPSYGAVLFDLDGTLIDSVGDIHAAVNQVLEALALRPLDCDRVASFLGNGLAHLVRRCLVEAGGRSDDHARVLREVERRYAESPAVLTKTYPAVRECLKLLSQRGLPLGVCTNKPQWLAETILERLGLRAHFKAVVGDDAARALKPDPAALRACADQLDARGMPLLYVGDSEIDEQSALNANLPFALFTRGYRSKPATEMQAIFRFEHYMELTHFILPGAHSSWA